MVHSSRLQKNKIGNPLPFFSLPDFSYYCFLFLLSLFPFLFWIPWAFSFYPVLSSYSVFFPKMKIKEVRCRKGRNKEATKDQKDIGGGWGRLNKDDKEDRRKEEKICWITHHLPSKTIHWNYRNLEGNVRNSSLLTTDIFIFLLH